jgi:hypothetical protein
MAKQKLSVALLTLASVACGSDLEIQRPTGTLTYEPDRPELMPGGEVPVYSGTNEYVLQAQSQHRTGLELHRNVVIRTCGPTGGVCHNRKEYPDLHTPANFLNAVGAPCNVQSGDYSAVYDGCEQPGDRLKLGDEAEVEIGYVNYIPGPEEEYGDDFVPTAETPGLHLYLQAPLTGGGDRRRTWGAGHFIRSFVNNGNVDNVAYERFETQWHYLEDGKHLFGVVREYQVDRVMRLLDVGVEQGDMNRNGVFGARSREPFKLLEPGKPEASYLIGRLRGQLGDEKIPGTRMPLANDPLTIPDMLALYCFIENLPTSADGVIDFETPINYETCRWSADPEGLNLLGSGASWLGRVKPLIEANCGGCHGGSEPQGDLALLGDGMYETVLGMSKQKVDMPLITPGDPANSYLWLKLNADASITGLGMPVDPLAGVRKLSDGALADIETWIMNGALEED